MAVHRFFILAFAALPLFATDAAAQDAARYRNWDRNNDGVITRSEWRGTARQFLDLDWNRDGVLSGDEVRDREWESTADDWDVDSFVALDRNNNGRISRGEWRGTVAMFRQIDRNRDNQITRGEFMNANTGVTDPFDDAEMDSRDYNRDGFIDRSEWNGTRAMFNRLDVNRDGALSQRELANDVARTRLGNVVTETVDIDSRQAWTNTGIHVSAGDVITVRADGTIQMSTNQDDRATPAGAISGRNARNSPRPDQRAGGLLLRVGNGAVEYVGESGTYAAPVSGQLYLGVNDDHFADNTGFYRVSLSIEQR